MMFCDYDRALPEKYNYYWPFDKRSYDRLEDDIPCMIEEFFRREREAGRHTSVCMISCPCRRCNPYSL